MLKGEGSRPPGPRVWPEQFGAEYDFENPGKPTTRYLVCSTQRSGSHYVGHVLRSTRQLGCPLEYLSQKNFPLWTEMAQSAGQTDALSYIYGRRTGPNGVFGCKVQLTQLQYARGILTDTALLGEFRFVFLTRRDLLAQAVSFARATQTDSWNSGMSAIAEAKYDRALIETKLKQIVNNNARWLEYFHAFGIDFLPVEYESFCEETTEEVRRIAKFLAVDVDVGSIEQDVRMKRQGDARNHEWVDRFVAESRKDPALVGLHQMIPHRPSPSLLRRARRVLGRWAAR